MNWVCSKKNPSNHCALKQSFVLISIGFRAARYFKYLVKYKVDKLVKQKFQTESYVETWSNLNMQKGKKVLSAATDLILYHGRWVHKEYWPAKNWR